MLTAEAVDLLRDIVAIPSPSFSESAVCDFISGWMDERGLKHERLGNNIIAEHITDPSGQTLMLCAHMDEIGFIVTFIEENGSLRFNTLGGITGNIITFFIIR